MQRRSNRSAILEEKRKSNLRWSGRVEDRDRDRELAERIRSSQEHSVSDQGSPSISECLAAGSADGSQLQREISATRGDPQGAEDSAEKAAGNGRLVPLGAHHEGSFRVYMSHKMEKLRNQVGGGVSLRAGPEGGVFKGVVAHINGYTSVPVATLRELLSSRGGIVEAYNTSRCTHMICETLPYAKIRELRKLLHPPTVVRSSWVADSARAGRRLPVAGYVVDGVFVQKRTLAASFAGASAAASSTPVPPRRSNSDDDDKDGRVVAGGGKEAPDSCESIPQPLQGGPAYGRPLPGKTQCRVIDSRVKRKRQSESVPERVDAPSLGCDDALGDGSMVGDGFMAGNGSARKSLATWNSPTLPPDGQEAMPFSDVGTIASQQQQHHATDIVGPGVGSSRGSVKDFLESGQAGPAVDEKGDGRRSTSKPQGGRVAPLPTFDLPGVGVGGEAGRSTKNDPTFMETFFQKSRLHYIGVGRARAVKLVNAGLAARAMPGAKQPVFGGPLGRGQTRVVLHVDMDCFFVSVLLRNRPELRERPVAVAHNASNAEGAGSSEISSCNYPARAKGVKAGMFMMTAKDLCPELVVLRYDFEAYSDASDKMYGVFLRFAPVVMAVSCDEAFLELGQGKDPVAAAAQIRRTIFEETGCTASAGASTNMLLARMATKEAKPDGQFYLSPETAMRHMGPLPVEDLPGVGWKLKQRLNEAGLRLCADLWPLSLAHMQKGLALGDKTGLALWEACRGIDNRVVQAPPDRKSIGAEVNYGVRFDTQSQADEFLSKLAVELSSRMAGEGVVGRALTLKIMKQRDGVAEPRKFLGHGICDARSKLHNLPGATDAPEAIRTHALRLLGETRVPPEKIRGIGLQMSRLEPASQGGGAVGKAGGALHEWLIKPAKANDGLNGGRACDSAETATAAGEEKDGVLDLRLVRQQEKDGKQPDSGAKGGAVREASNQKRPRSCLDSIEEEGTGTADPRRARRRCFEPDHNEPQKKNDSPASGRDPAFTENRGEETFRSPGVKEGPGCAKGNVCTTRPSEVGRSPSCSPPEFPPPPAAPAPAVAAAFAAATAELLPPSTPSPRGAKTPASGGCGSGNLSLSQITLSQVDSTVLDALPPDLRDEVLSQLDARQRRKGGLPPSSSPLSSYSDVIVATTAQGATTVRDGFDPTVRGVSTKTQQVSLANLWTLRKLTEEDHGGAASASFSAAAAGGQPSVFDRDSLRAMPLGLGLQYASLTASQRALVARRYDRSINSSSGPLPPVPPSPDTATGGRGSPLSLPRGEMPRSAVVASSSPPSGEPVALRLSQVDRDVLECLPIEMREEVLRAVGAVASKNEVHAPPSHDNASFSMKNAPSCEENVASPEINAASPEGINERDLIVVDLRTPGSPSLDLTELSQVDGDDDNDHATCGSRRHPRRRQRHVFEAESVGTLRAALRAWVGGSVRSPSEWHLELLYRYLEQLVEDGRLDETVKLLRCLRRLATKADTCCRDDDSPRRAGGAADDGGSITEGGQVGWVKGYKAVLEAVQNLVRRLTGGATLSLIC